MSWAAWPALPSLDPNDYPVHSGPPARCPQEADVPGFYRANGPWPAPYDPMILARRYAEPEMTAFPEPEVTSRDGVPGPVKRAVTAMEDYAAFYGWRTCTTYARGHVPHGSTGKPGPDSRDSLAVRMQCGDRRAVAVYVGADTAWSWATLYVWRLGEFPIKYASVTAFKVALVGERVLVQESLQ